MTSKATWRMYSEYQEFTIQRDQSGNYPQLTNFRAICRLCGAETEEGKSSKDAINGITEHLIQAH